MAPPMSLIPCSPARRLPASSQPTRRLQLLAALARERATTLEGLALGAAAPAGSGGTIATVLAESAAFLLLPLPLPLPLDAGAATGEGGATGSVGAAVKRALVALTAAGFARMRAGSTARLGVRL